MKTWTYRWDEKKYPRRTGMIWRGGILSYRWGIGPKTLFWHTMTKMLYSMYSEQNTLFLHLSEVKSLPERSGKTIQFFTYQKET